MPFAKRVVEPQLLCRYHIPNTEGVLFDDLFCVNNLALSRSLRQLSDMAQHACSIFKELESELLSNSLRLRGLQNKINRLQETCSRLDYKLELVPESSIDIECKVKFHYQIPWHHQKNVFQPSTRPTCVDELYRQASFGLWVLRSDHQRRRSSSFEKITTVPQMPMYPSTHINDHRTSNLTMLESINTLIPTKCCHFSPWSKKVAHPDSDTDGVVLGLCSKFPIPNTPSTLDKQTNWSKALPLPTPEERMKSNSQVIISSVIPINVTGLTFDRDATLHCSVVNSKFLLQRRRTLRRRKMGTCDLQVFSPREQTVVIYTSPDFVPTNEELESHHSFRDSFCQTADFFISGAPSHKLLRSKGVQTSCINLSYSASDISLLSYSPNAMFTAPLSPRLRTRSLPQDASWVSDNGGGGEKKEHSPFHKEALLSAYKKLVQKEKEEGAVEQATSENQRGKYQQISRCPEQSWIKGPQPKFTADLESCEISSSTKTLSNPIYFVSAAASALEGPVDNRDDHQSSSGNWSGSSSTCPSQTSETIPLAASSSLTSSTHSDSELSLITPNHANDDSADLILNQNQDLRTQRSGSFASTVMDILERAVIETTVEHEWSNSNVSCSRSQHLSLEPSRDVENNLACPSFTSIVTCESSLSDKTPSEKADTMSHYSVDTEGYYTSMHFDCGLKGSKSYMYSSITSSDADFILSDVSYSKTLGRRCLSLRKSKIKPYPPKRSSSLGNIENIPDEKEPTFFCLQHPLLSTKEGNSQLVSSNTADSPSTESKVVSPLTDLSRADGPPSSKIRSTEDLFAIIHRSKRKVLGWKDYNKLEATNCPSFASGSRTITSNVNSATRSPVPKSSSSSVMLPSQQRVPVPIYRNAKKSITSKEDFKQLLLKKGSCSYSNYRMSATDILKSHVIPKSHKDLLSESPFLLRQTEEQTISPLQQNSDPIDFFPGANADGYFPKSSPAFSNSGQGRSRILPPANSRYSARCRPYLAQMQVISEGETENSDGSPHDENLSQGYS